MIEMIENFAFDYDNEVYQNSEGVMLDLDYNNNSYNAIFFKKNDKEKKLNETFYAKDFKELKEKIAKFLLTKKFTDWKIKTLNYPNPPNLPSEEEIKEMINQSNIIEIKYLEKKTSSLEERTKILEEKVEVLENSVEDLENWRHG